MLKQAYRLADPGERLGVSIVICCHNSARLLPATLARLKCQQIDGVIGWEVVVIDNASSDETGRTARVCWGVGSAWEPSEIRAVIRARRSAVSMSSKAGAALLRYQGSLARRAAMACPQWPLRAYQVMTRVQVSRANGTVRSTARRTRVRASPAPGVLRAPAKACSMV